MPDVAGGSKYRIRGLIGKGGLGAVYEAIEVETGRRVAIKCLLESDDLGRERLLREARAARKVQHPNVVKMIEVDLDLEGRPYLVMERLRGVSLSTLLYDRKRLPLPLCAAIHLPVIEALIAAHAMGVVHRDLKPGNVFLAVEEDRIVPKILDFGIAKMIGPQSVQLVTLTQTGNVIGSPSYMSPEQIMGSKDVDPTTDVWSLGVMLYEALGGVRPFDGPSFGQTFFAIVQHDPPPLESLAPDLPGPILELVRGCLHKDLPARMVDLSAIRQALCAVACPMPTVEELLPADFDRAPAEVGAKPNVAIEWSDDTDLQKIERTLIRATQDTTKTPAPPLPASQRTRWIAVAIGTVAVVAAAAAWMGNDRGPDEPKVTALPMPTPEPDLDPPADRAEAQETEHEKAPPSVAARPESPTDPTHKRRPRASIKAQARTKKADGLFNSPDGK